MLARLWQWLQGFLGRARPAAPRMEGRERALQREGPRAQRPKVGAKAGEAEEVTYLGQLRAEARAYEPLTSDDEQQVSDLVQAISAYVSAREIEPPVMPANATRMLELLRRPDVDLAELTRLIERDQATAARLLSVANSAAYKGRNAVINVRDAVVYLGTEEVAQIAIALATRALFDAPSKRATGVVGERFMKQFKHAMICAFAGSHLQTRRTRRHADAAFLGGLFHDVGKAVALRAVAELVDKQGRALPPARIIDEAVHQLHRDPRAMLYRHWELPPALMQMCMHHHVLPAEPADDLYVVRLVSGLDALREGAAVEQQEALVDIEESAAMLKLSEPELRVAHTETRDFGRRVELMFA